MKQLIQPQRAVNCLRALSFFGLLSFLICSSQTSFGQKSDTVYSLHEIQITGISNQKFMVGQYVQLIDSASLTSFRFNTADNFLQFNVPIAFKSYGAGQATSISFRGTSPNHTAVVWNGININSPTLGQSDFSTIPLTSFDKLSIQYGAAGSTLGSDAIGGSILLESNITFKKEFSVGISCGSFANFQGLIGYSFLKKLPKNWLFSSKTKLTGSNFLNHYPYDYRGSFPVEPSTTHQKGLLQDLYWQRSNGNLISFNAWLLDNKVIIQPAIISFRETTQTAAYRFLVGYDFKNTTLKAGFIKDILTYGKGDFSTPDHSTTDRLLLKATHEYALNKQKTIVKMGGEVSHYIAQVDGYGNGNFTENRGDSYVLIRNRFSSKFLTSFNLRQAFTTGYNPPLTPSFGIEYKVFTHEKYQFSLLGNLGKGYRVPTLNERFWKTLGNPLLKPETSFNKEVGVSFNTSSSKHWKTSLRANYFHNLVDNWTYWNPDKNYRVENLLQVLAHGFESFVSIYYSNQVINGNFSVNYSYTNSSQQKGYNAYSVDIIGKQLPYVPRQAVAMNARITYQKPTATPRFMNDFTFALQGLYNGEKFVTADNSGRPIEPYYLLNALIVGKIITHKFQANKPTLSIALQANNLSNTIYQNLKKNAMPGRSFALSLHYTLY